MTKELIVSKASIRDIRRLAEIVYLAQALRGMPVTGDFDEEIINESNLMHCELTRTKDVVLKVCDNKKEILGIASYRQNGTLMHCTRFYTLPSDKKPGGALMTRMLKDSASSKSRCIWATAANDDVVGFYTHYGFTLTHPRQRRVEKWMTPCL